MRPARYLVTATILSAAGAAFAGYLGLTRLTRGVCAFDEPCPLFAGQPACYVGFALFALALAVSVAALAARAHTTWPMAANAAIAAAGALFAADVSVEELRTHAGYRLGLPTCAWGLVFFVALLVVSLAAWMHQARPRQLAPR